MGKITIERPEASCAVCQCSGKFLMGFLNMPGRLCVTCLRRYVFIRRRNGYPITLEETVEFRYFMEANPTKIIWLSLMKPY